MCGIEIKSAASNQKYCSECRAKKKKQNNKQQTNDELLKDCSRAISLKMSYGEYRNFVDKLNKLLKDK